MAHSGRNGQGDVPGNGDDSADETMVGWHPNYMTLRESAVNYPPEQTSPPKPVIPDLRTRNIAHYCNECGESLRAITKITRAQENEIAKRWKSSHSHTNDA